MAIYDYLPKYHQIEANNLKGLQPGFVVAQMPVASGENAKFAQPKFNVLGSESAVRGEKGDMIANGHIVTIGANGITDVKTATDPLFIVYNEPLNTVVDGAKFYATNTEEEHLRLVQLVPGDEWMSDIDLLATSYPSHGGAMGSDTFLQDRIVKITGDQGKTKDNWYDVTTLADGTPAHHYMFIK